MQPADLALVACPVLLIMGLESPVVARRATERAASCCPVPRSGWSPGRATAPLTHPHLVNPIVAAHLAATQCGLAAVRAA